MQNVPIENCDNGRSRREPNIEATVMLLESSFGLLALTLEQIYLAQTSATNMAPKHNADDISDNSSKLLDAHSAAEQLGVDASWLLQRAREGRIPHYRLGKFVRFDVDEIRSECRQMVDRQGY